MDWWRLGRIVDANEKLVFVEGTALCQGACPGCTYTGACNYDVDATEDDGTCDFTCLFNGIICGGGFRLESDHRPM